MNKLLFFTAILLTSLGFADYGQNRADQKIIYDIDMSPFMGAEDMLTGHSACIRLEDYLIQTPEHKKKPFFSGLGRVAELLLFWNPLNEVIATVQHEVFGHGYRIRDLSSNIPIKAGSYKFALPMPYGWGGAATRFKFAPPYLNSQLSSAVSIAGVEANGILAQRMIFRWIETNEIDGRQSSLYQNAQFDITVYILSIRKNFLDCFDRTGHDMEDYIGDLALTYPGAKLSKNRLKKLSLLNFVDPFTYYTMYSYFKYIGTGRSSTVPMIPLGNVGYLPSLRLGLTPFGPEIYFNHFFRYQNAPIYFYVRYGEFEQQYYGSGIEFPKLIQTKNASYGFRVDFWKQPKIIFGPGKYLDDDHISFGFSKSAYRKRYGAAISLMMDQALYQNVLYFTAQVGWKSQGYLPGESLDNSPIARIGLSGKF